MSKMTLVIGLCGSGKTYQIKKIVEETGAKIFGVGEDWDEGFSPVDRTNFESLYSKAVKHLLSGNDCVASDISLCVGDIRQFVISRLSADVPSVEIAWVCMKNDRTMADKNVEWRAKRGQKTDVNGHLAINKFYSEVYTYPEGATIIPIFDATQLGDRGEEQYS